MESWLDFELNASNCSGNTKLREATGAPGNWMMRTFIHFFNQKLWNTFTHRAVWLIGQLGRPRTCHIEHLVSREKWKLKQLGANSQGIGTGGCWQIGNKMPFSLSLQTLSFGKRRNLKNVRWLFSETKLRHRPWISFLFSKLVYVHIIGFPYSFNCLLFYRK